MPRNFSKFILIALGTIAIALPGCEPKRDNGPSQPDSNSGAMSNDKNATMVAMCNLEEIGGSGVTGTLHFTQKGEMVTVSGEIKGLTPGKHGFHVHATGDISDKKTGKSAGDHFDPTKQPHGRPADKERHVGDLGNIEANQDGVAKVNITDSVIKLSGSNSIVGKALVVHAGEDKFTQPTGDAGDRVAFGLIELEK